MANPWRLLQCIRIFTRCETQSPLPYSSLKAQLWYGCSLFVLGNMEICKQSPLWQLPLPTICPWHSERSPKSHIPPEKWKCQPRAFMLFIMRYLWWQESRAAGLLGPFQTSAPAGQETHLLQTSFPLPMLTHTPKQLIYKNTHQQIILNVWKLINSQETWATEILTPVSFLKRCLGMDNRRDIWTNTVCKGSC